MSNYNRVILAGKLTRDPEIRHTPKGAAVCKIGIAINRKWKDAEGQAREEATFVDVDAFGKQAEVIGQYFKKGRAILIDGRLKLDQWDDKQTGQKRSRLGVVLESFSFIGGGDKREEGDAPEAKPARQVAPVSGEPAQGDDVPF